MSESERVQVLEEKIEDLETTIQRQQNTINALQKTNQILTEQVEEVTKQLDSVNDQWLNSKGLGGGDLNESITIKEEHNDTFKEKHRRSSSISGFNAESELADQDDVYSSGDECETYKTLINDDHELLPIKQGFLKKKSENMHRYNNRYVVLYPSFLLYYDSCPIGKNNGKNRRNSSYMNVLSSNKNSTTTEINHPKGTLILRNYHVAVRKDTKRYDITFVPHKSAISMGLADKSAKIRFRCKTLNELNDWTDKIRTAITSANTGFIKYDVRTDFISNDLGYLHQKNDSQNNLMSPTNGNKKESMDKSNDDTKDNIPTAGITDDDINNNDVDDDEKDDEQSKTKTQMFGLDDLKQMMKNEEELKNTIEIQKRDLSQYKQQMEQLQSELEIKKNELDSEQRISEKKRQGLIAQMEELENQKDLLSSEITKLRSDINKMELKYKEQHKKLKKYKHHEEDIMKNIEMFKSWNKKLNENSLQYLGTIYPKHSNKQLFEHCQKGCVQLLEESYDVFNKKKKHKKEKEKENENKEDNENKENDGDDKKKHRHHKQSKVIKEMLTTYTEIFRRTIKTTINYASLQQAHNGAVEDIKMMKKDIQELSNLDDNGNTLADDALIMASMTASIF